MSKKKTKSNKLGFETGKVLEEFDVTDKKGEKLHVIIRFPRKKDIAGLHKYTNSLIKEAEYLNTNRQQTLQEQKKWLNDAIEGMRQGKSLTIFVVINGIISGSGVITKGVFSNSHVGDLGIYLRKKYTSMGIGTRFMELMMNESLKIGVESINLRYVEDNFKAKLLYEKLGFQTVGIVPKTIKKRDKYYNQVIMYKILV